MKKNPKSENDVVQQTVLLCGDMNVSHFGEYHLLATLNDNLEYIIYDWGLNHTKAEKWLQTQLEEKIKKLNGERPPLIFFEEYKFLVASMNGFGDYNSFNLLEKNYLDDDSVFFNSKKESIFMKRKQDYTGKKLPRTAGFSIRDFFGPQTADRVPNQEEIYTEGILFTNGITIDHIFQLNLGRKFTVNESLRDEKEENGLSLEVFPNYVFDKKKRFNRLSDHNMLLASFSLI